MNMKKIAVMLLCGVFLTLAVPVGSLVPTCPIEATPNYIDDDDKFKTK
jgi:peroxiredoxin